MSKIECFKCGKKQVNSDKFFPGKFGTYICQECVSQHRYFICSECGEATSRMFIEWYQDEIPVCSSCMQSNFCYCYGCGEHIRTEDAKIVEFGTKLCQGCWVEIEGCKSIHDSKYTPDLTFFGESDYHFGVEIEIYSSDNRQKALEVFDEWNNHSMYIKKDTSLSESGFEIVSHPHTFKELKTAKWLKAIKTLKDSCTAFDKAGMHIHISRSAFDSNDHYDRFWSIWNEYPELVEWIAQRKSDQYAKVESKIGLKVNSQREHDRHCAINENNIHTVEVRVFNSSLKYSILMKNVEFTHAVIEYTRQVTAVSIVGLWSFIQKHKKMYPNLVKFRNKNRKGWKKVSLG